MKTNNRKLFTWALIIAVLGIANNIQASSKSIFISTEKTNTKVLNSNKLELNLQFQFGDITYFDVKTPMGTFTEIHMNNAYSTNRIGEPILPAQRKLIAIPFGAEVNIQVSSFNVQTINLSEHGVTNTLMPLQYDVPKNMDAADIPFEYKAEAYTTKSFNENKMVTVEILGVMRGVRIARVSIEPIRYNPSTNQLEVYNDIEISLSYKNADWELTNQTFKATYSPFFDPAYRQLLNVDDVYNDHPDLLTYPVRMLIVSHPLFTDALQAFIEWKTMMGYHLTVAYTDEIGSSAGEIQTWVHDQYNEGVANGSTPDFVVFVGDVQQVPASAIGSATSRKTDLYYCSVDGDYFPEMYYGRLSATNVSELTAQLDKIIYYEKYEFETPEYLDDITLIAGADASWNPRVGQPTIHYGTQNYFNTAHGYDNIYVYLNSYSGCYDDEKFQTSFINYTAHCNETVWADPYLGINDINNMNNPNEYPIAIGNCCMSADFGYGECIGEAFLREENGGAVGYIGSSPSSYWFEDFYWSVGAFPIQGDNNGYVPTNEETTMGSYDAAWGDAYYCLHGLAFAGNLAVTEVDIQGYASHSSPLYYWQAYNTLGDPSLIPYHTQGSENNVDHMETIPLGVNEYQVSAEPGSYVAITKNGVIHGTAYVDGSGIAQVEITPFTEQGSANIVVTKPQYIPHIAIVPTTGSYDVSIEDFETGDFSQFDWQFNYNPWTIVDTEVYEGIYATKSADISNSQVSSIELDYSIETDGDLSFYYKVSSESGYDKLIFYINNTVQGEWSGEIAWNEASYELSAGNYNLKWEYSKDGFDSNGTDCAWVDFISFPSSPPEQTTVSISPNSQTVNTNEIFTTTVEIEEVTNLGSFELSLGFDPDYLQANSVTLGDFLGSTGRQIFPLVNDIDNTNGLISYAVTTMGATPSGPNGDGVLLNIEWSATANLDDDMITDILIQNLQLTEPNGTILPANSQNGTVTISSCYIHDFDCDCDVDIVDVTMAAYRYGTEIGDANYDPAYDLDSDGDIDIVDITMVTYDYGWSCNGGKLPKLNLDFVNNDDVSLSLQQKSNQENEIYEIAIRVEQVEQLGAFELELQFDPNNIEIIDWKQGTFLEKTSRKLIPVYENLNQDEGLLSYAIGSLGSENLGAKGAGELLIIKYCSKNNQDNDFNLIHAQLARIDGKVIPFKLKPEKTEDDLTQILKTYPNPMSEQLTMEYQVNNEGDSHFTLYNIYGERIREWTRNHQKKGSFSIVIKSEKLPAGVYFISMKHNKLIVDTHRIIVKE